MQSFLQFCIAPDILPEEGTEDAGTKPKATGNRGGYQGHRPTREVGGQPRSSLAFLEAMELRVGALADKPVPRDAGDTHLGKDPG